MQNASANRRLRDVQFLSSLGEVQMPRRRFEGKEALPRRERVPETFHMCLQFCFLTQARRAPPHRPPHRIRLSIAESNPGREQFPVPAASFWARPGSIAFRSAY